MANKTFNFYCDESTHLQNDGELFMIISYVSSAYNQIEQHKDYIKLLRAKHKIKGEIKWNSVSSSQYPFFADVVDYFFSTDLNFRAIIVEKDQINENRPGFHYDDFYFKMYYQLIHHKINMSYNYNIYLDVKDTISNEKLATLKDILKWNASIRSFQFIRSYESPLMQMADLLMGAINYKLRGLNKVKAKIKLIKKIEESSKLPLTNTTPKNKDKFNLFFIDLK